MKPRTIFLILVLSILLASSAMAVDVCCEKLAGSDDYCVYTDEEECDPQFKSAAVACEQTSFCKTGCCYSSDEGQCYKNVARAECSSVGESVWDEDSECGIEQCQKGCCLLGTQGFYVTQVRCKLETSVYGNVTMEWDPNIESEMECQAESRSQDMGCCVSGDTCTFGTRSTCASASAEPTAETAVGGEGFYKDMICSNDRLSCGCAKQTNTGCYDDKVYWFDSCGNRENVYSTDKSKSYNSGYVLDSDQICNGPAINDPDCGNCDYAAGSICRSTEVTGVEATEGDFMCSKTACDIVYDDSISPSAGAGKKNGESWCLYDSDVGKSTDLVGSRHFRRLCINGEEMNEPCMDYREELCMQGVLTFEPTDTYAAFSAVGDYVESACRDNRWEDCMACNDAEAGCGSDCVNPDYECSGCEDEAEDAAKELAIQQCCAKKCCEEEALRDCYFIQPGGEGKDEVVIVEGGEDGGVAAIYNVGYCAPQVPPGLQFWPSEAGEFPTSSTRSSPATTAAVTTGDSASRSSSGPSTNAESQCGQADQECTITWSIGGTGRMGIGGIGTQSDWECVSNCHCTEPEWVVGGNTLCTSLGDCGAYWNYLGKATMDGYVNTASNEKKGDKGLYFNGYELKESDIGDWKTIIGGGGSIGLPSEEAGGGGMGGFFSKIGDYISGEFALPLTVFVASGLYTGFVLKTSFLSGVTGGYDILGAGIGEGTMGGAASKIYGKITVTADPGYAVKIGSKDLTWNANKKVWIDGTKEASAELSQKASEQALKEGSAKQSGGSVIGAVNTIMWLYTAYQIIDIFFADIKEETYTMACAPWVAQEGGSDCTKCNEDTEKPCSLYRCKSLGQSCYLVNQGTSDEECIDLNPNDVNSPIIEPWEDAIPTDYTITETTEEGNKGYKINEKIGPYDAIVLGITTNEPAQCKFTSTISTDFDEMVSYFGDAQYVYEHQINFVIPQELTTKEALRKTGEVYDLYIRCKDAAGNKNERDYFIRFTLKPEPDMTPPVIEVTSIDNGAYAQADVTETDFSIYVNERAECNYDTIDKDYELMEHDFDCASSSLSVSSVLAGLYECETELSLENLTEYTWYIRCKDTSDNVNKESFKFELNPTEPLEIISIGPTGTFYEADVTLKAVTSDGAENGYATCAYSDEETSFSNMIEFLTTGETLHEQLLTPGIGEFTYYVKCMDIAGNIASDNTTFTLDVDMEGPKIVFIYITGSNYLHMEMDEPSTCEYANSTFVFGEGKAMTGIETTIHELAITEPEYHIVCEDIYFNQADYIVYP
ncbi:MAG: hypothetical protein KKA79_07895 [Nanoarchaeota archaeon]|nr:hypothetical protein [Nanoarchaeota archaeon]